MPAPSLRISHTERIRFLGAPSTAVFDFKHLNGIFTSMVLTGPESMGLTTGPSLFFRLDFGIELKMLTAT